MKSSDSVFSVLDEEGLTTLEVFYNRQKDKFTLRGAKEWKECNRRGKRRRDA